MKTRITGKQVEKDTETAKNYMMAYVYVKEGIQYLIKRFYKGKRIVGISDEVEKASSEDPEIRDYIADCWMRLLSDSYDEICIDPGSNPLEGGAIITYWAKNPQDRDLVIFAQYSKIKRSIDANNFSILFDSELDKIMAS